MRGKQERKAEGLRTRKERGEEEARERVAVTGARMKREREEETEETRRAGLQDPHLPSVLSVLVVRPRGKPGPPSGSFSSKILGQKWSLPAVRPWAPGNFSSLPRYALVYDLQLASLSIVREREVGIPRKVY